jgi:putative phage-type endonuclease
MQVATREQFLADRRKGIGGSDVAAILGLSPWKTPLDVYLDKIGEGRETDSEAAIERMKWGNLLEDVIAAEYAEREGVKIERVSAILQDAAEPRFLANLDRIIYAPTGNGILECKNVGEYSADAWDGDRVPDSYMAQMQWYLGVTGLRWGVFAALVGGRRLVTKRVEADDEFIGQLRAIGSKFWRGVSAGVPPEPDGSTDATELMGKLYPGEAGLEVELPDAESAFLLTAYVAKKAAADMLAEAVEELKNKLKARMHNAERAIIGPNVITWKPQTRATIDTKRLRAERADVADEYTTETTTRVFKVKVQK